MRQSSGAFIVRFSRWSSFDCSSSEGRNYCVCYQEIGSSDYHLPSEMSYC